MGIRKANRAEIPTWNAADLGVAGEASRVNWAHIYTPPVREGEVEMLTGTVQEQVEALVEKLFAEKVI